jgi:hypothetical protein
MSDPQKQQNPQPKQGWNGYKIFTAVVLGLIAFNVIRIAIQPLQSSEFERSMDDANKKMQQQK